MDFMGQAAGEVLGMFPMLWNTLHRHVHYINSVQKHIDKLNRELRELQSKCLDNEAQVREAERQLERPMKQVENWFTEVANMEVEVNSITSEFEQRKTCFNTCCPNYFSRYKFGKRALKAIKAVVYLKRSGNFTKLAVCLSPPRVVKMPMTSTYGQAKYEQMLWVFLHDEKMGIACVYGMGGVGKTTLLKTINNRHDGCKNFDLVIWVTVSKDHNVGRIQIEIAEKLGLLFHDNDDQERQRMKIFARLSENSRHVLILDDLWEELSLDDVGIPKPNTENKCKILLTTRFIDVCNDMEADILVRVDTLSHEEAWNLFHEKVGEVVLLPDIRPLAEEVVKECGGLPLAIITVGRALRGKMKKELWLDARRALKDSAAAEVKGMEPKVFQSLKLSYDHLETDSVKLCFLYCALYAEDYVIDVKELVRHWTVEGFISNVDNFEDASNKGCAIVERLIDACLLEKEFGSDSQVKMHDLIHDMAIWITSSSSSLQSSSVNHGPKFLVRAGMGLEEAPNEEVWEGVGRVSLMNNNIEELSIRPSCPNLVTLMLARNYNLRMISFSFFDLMPRLRVLDLSSTNIEFLPISFSSLVSLRALILRHCESLQELPPLGHLKQLQYLDLSNCDQISELPQDIGELINLKRLDLSSMWQLSTLPCGVMSRLSSIEELCMEWPMVKWNEASTATLWEIASLMHLRELNITIDAIDNRALDLFQEDKYRG